MKLAKKYSISNKNQRSTRIDSDLSKDFFAGIIYHGTVQTALETLAQQYKNANQSAFTLTGSYGSGKSTMALLLTGILHHDSKLRTKATKVIDANSYKILSKAFPIKKGWLQIRSVSGIHNPIDTFWNATLKALQDHPETHNFYEAYKDAQIKNDVDLLKIWTHLFNEAEQYVDGVLIIADEMGKSLEYINKNKGELHLFQDLAELLGRSKTPTIYLGLLHQSFSEYAKDRGQVLQEEWAKIQGRFIDILYNVSSDETVSLIANSIVNHSDEKNDNENAIQKLLKNLNDSEQRKNYLLHHLKGTAPLHPIVALLLGPLSKRRFNQNERSTFGFLNSQEPCSLQLFLQNNTKIDSLYCLHHLWDYLETNIEHAILSSPDGHDWSEASDAIKRADVDPLKINILKSIALINLFGRPAKIFATKEIIQVACDIPDEQILIDNLEYLKNKSLIIYRKYLSTWMIFEGSDLDISAEVDRKIRQLNDINEPIRHIDYSNQIIAKHHYHTTGTLRWAEQRLCSHLDDLTINSNSYNSNHFASFILLLNTEPSKKISQFANEYKNHAIGIAPNPQEILIHANELYALKLIQADNHLSTKLKHDRIAQKEYNSRLNKAHHLLIQAVNDNFTEASWQISSKEYRPLTPLSTIASDLANAIFYTSPKILNEIINRNKLSAAAVAASKKLLEAMSNCAQQENLGIDRFPPEKSIYISCLQNTNLHQFNGQHWHFSDENLSTELSFLFNQTTKFLKDNTGNKVNISEIKQIWSSKPFGINHGLILVFLFAYFQINKEKIAFYEKTLSGDFEYIASTDSDYIHKLQKAPKELAVKYIELNEKEKSWINALAIFTSGFTNQVVKTDLLSVATPLVTFMHNLPLWVKNANHLTTNSELNQLTLKIRDIFLHAIDPYDLLNKRIIQTLDPKQALTVCSRLDKLEECLTILKHKHEQMLSDMNSEIKCLFNQEEIEFYEMCDIVENRTGDLRLRAFARELRQSRHFGLKWLESLMSVVIGRRMQSWNENDIKASKQKIFDYAQDFYKIINADSLASSNNIQKIRQTKNISLIIETDDGKLITQSKEIIISKNPSLASVKDSFSQQLDNLNEFERITILKQLLSECLSSSSTHQTKVL